jgi:hypothetical protein
MFANHVILLAKHALILIHAHHVQTDIYYKAQVASLDVIAVIILITVYVFNVVANVLHVIRKPIHASVVVRISIYINRRVFLNAHRIHLQTISNHNAHYVINHVVNVMESQLIV